LGYAVLEYFFAQTIWDVLFENILLLKPFGMHCLRIFFCSNHLGCAVLEYFFAQTIWDVLFENILLLKPFGMCCLRIFFYPNRLGCPASATLHRGFSVHCTT
jgi:hypothetical protein